MRAICFIQETKEADLTMRQQQLVCRRALRKLLWRCEAELFAQAGTEQASLALRPGMTGRRASLLQPRRAGLLADHSAAIRRTHVRSSGRQLDRTRWSALDDVARV